MRKIDTMSLMSSSATRTTHTYTYKDRVMIFCNNYFDNPMNIGGIVIKAKGKKASKHDAFTKIPLYL